MTDRPHRAWLGALVAAPALLVTTIFCVDTLGSALGRRVIWPVPALTLADAVIFRNAGEAASLIINGADPNAPSPLRRASSRFGRRSILPVEAAVLTGETHLLQLLVNYSARLDVKTTERLRCQADRLGEDQMREWLDARLGRAVSCDQ
jgi:hypothetical protein